MTHHDPQMHEWKQEMKQLTLSKEAIARIEQKLDETPTKRWSPAIMLMPFAAVIAAILFFAGMPTTEQTTTGIAPFNVQSLTVGTIIWATIANILAVVNYCMMLAVVLKVPRIQHIAMFEAFQNRMNKRRIWQLVAATILFALFGWGLVLLTPIGLVLVQCYVGLLFLPIVHFIQLLMTRHNEWPTCAHCGEIISKQTLRKRNFGGTPQCSTCDKPLYESLKKRQKGMRIYFFMPIIMFFPTITQSMELASQIFFIVLACISAFITIKYVDPYTIVFTKDDKIPPLW